MNILVKNVTRRRRLRTQKEVENRIVKRLTKASEGSPDYWDFRDGAEDLASKKLFQYPAMMVPALQKQVIAAVLNARPNVRTIADPFLGSGTILALSMLSGRAFVGQDINPLAILISKTRAFSLNHALLKEAVERVKAAAKKDKSIAYAVSFIRQSKWFTRGANIGLSRIRRSILQEPDLKTRRFLWVCLAETIRLNSNSRTSTYKLHVKPAENRTATADSVLASFSEIAEYNLQVVLDFRDALRDAGQLNENGDYKHPVQISYGNTAQTFPKAESDANGKYQLVVTSPPYGDNRTTVPYGQAAWLPLQWIDFRDIDSAIPHNAADGAYDVDNRSLGGRRQAKTLATRKKTVEDVGPQTKRYVEMLSAIGRDGLSRLVHFVFDLRNAVTQVAANCDDAGYFVVTSGNRNISGTVCPLADICSELVAHHNSREVIRITRQIPSKRMPGKNSHSATINHEYISIFQRIPPNVDCALNEHRREARLQTTN